MEDILSKALFDVSIQLVLGDDDIFLFYTDPWLGGGGLDLLILHWTWWPWSQALVEHVARWLQF
jgi:hypothetical protein